MARHKKKKRLNKLNLTNVPYQENAKPQIVGMYSIKTIRLKNGSVLIQQGQQIASDVVSQAENADENVLSELIANAMPGNRQ